MLPPDGACDGRPLGPAMVWVLEYLRRVELPYDDSWVPLEQLLTAGAVFGTGSEPAEAARASDAELRAADERRERSDGAARRSRREAIRGVVERLEERGLIEYHRGRNHGRVRVVPPGLSDQALGHHRAELVRHWVALAGIEMPEPDRAKKEEALIADLIRVGLRLLVPPADRRRIDTFSDYEGLFHFVARQRGVSCPDLYEILKKDAATLLRAAIDERYGGSNASRI